MKPKTESIITSQKLRANCFSTSLTKINFLPKYPDNSHHKIFSNCEEELPEKPVGRLLILTLLFVLFSLKQHPNCVIHRQEQPFLFGYGNHHSRLVSWKMKLTRVLALQLLFSVHHIGKVKLSPSPSQIILVVKSQGFFYVFLNSSHVFYFAMS